jgi:hypothetical protein
VAHTVGAPRMPRSPALPPQVGVDQVDVEVHRH